MGLKLPKIVPIGNILIRGGRGPLQGIISLKTLQFLIILVLKITSAKDS
jgi:hypothetical protein